MEPKLTLKSFSTFGLNTYEAKSYLSLLEKDRLSAVEVAKISGVPRGRVYEILDILLAKGLCRSIPGKVKYYSAVNPTVLREKMAAKLKSVESDVDKKKQELSILKKNTDDIIESLVPLFNESRKKNSPMDYIEIIKDPFQMHKRFLELVEKAEHEILGFDKPPYSMPNEKSHGEQENGQAEMLHRGVDIRAIYEIPQSKEEMEWEFKVIDKQVERGEKARIIEHLPIKMVVFDEKIVLFALMDPISAGPSFTTQVIEHPDIANSLKITFETLWEQAEDYHVLEDLLKNM